MPAGALVVQKHFVAGDAVAETTFAMKKREPGYAPAQGDWEFLVLDQDLRIEARGPMPLCARCHAAAPSDFLFGPP